MIPSICAQMHLDKHVIKLILETTQLLCGAWHIIDPDHKIYTPCYKLTHKNHPCSIWTRTSKENYMWLCQLGLALCEEYTYRYGKTHKCEEYLVDLTENIPPIPSRGFTAPAQAMPVVYKDKNAIDAYRNYYFFEKAYIHSWKGKVNSRETPSWIIDMHSLFNDD